MIKRLDLGAVSAYALAVEKGYKGTEEEFVEILTNALNYATQAQGSASAAAGSAEAAGNYKAQAEAVLGNVNLAGAQQIEAIEATGTQQANAAKEAIEAKGKETLDSIPDSYEVLQEDVTQLRGDFTKLRGEIIKNGDAIQSTAINGFAFYKDGNEWKIINYGSNDIYYYALEVGKTYNLISESECRLGFSNYVSGENGTGLSEYHDGIKLYDFVATYKYIYTNKEVDIREVSSKIEEISNELVKLGNTLDTLECTVYEGKIYRTYINRKVGNSIPKFGYAEIEIITGRNSYIEIDTSVDISNVTIKSQNYSGEVIYSGAERRFKIDDGVGKVGVLIKKTNGENWTSSECDLTNVKLIKENKHKTDAIYLCADDATETEKNIADIMFSDIDVYKLDILINTYLPKSIALRFSSGTFEFDQFTSKGYCIGIKSYTSIRRYVKIIGNTNRGDNKTTLKISANALSSMPVDECRVIGAENHSNTVTLDVDNISIELADNQHNIVCIDCSNNTAGRISMLSCFGVPSEIANTDNTPMPSEGCVGIRSWCGNDSGTYNIIDNCFCTGFYEGFQLGAEHTICSQCNGRFNYYAFSFGNYDYKYGTCSHPITLINCCDEHSACLPKFVKNGLINVNGSTGMQAVDMISYNMELIRPDNFGGGLVTPSHEDIPSTWCGNINYTAHGVPNVEGGLNGETGYSNIVSVKFFDSGSGKNFCVKNDTHKLGGTTVERLTYVPHYMQEYYDTDLHKKLIYDGENWVDYSGTVIN